MVNVVSVIARGRTGKHFFDSNTEKDRVTRKICTWTQGLALGVLLFSCRVFISESIEVIYVHTQDLRAWRTKVVWWTRWVSKAEPLGVFILSQAFGTKSWGTPHKYNRESWRRSISFSLFELKQWGVTLFRAVSRLWKVKLKTSSRQKFNIFCVKECLYEKGGGLSGALYPPKQVARQDVTCGIGHTHEMIICSRCFWITVGLGR